MSDEEMQALRREARYSTGLARLLECLESGHVPAKAGGVELLVSTRRSDGDGRLIPHLGTDGRFCARCGLAYWPHAGLLDGPPGDASLDAEASHVTPVTVIDHSRGPRGGDIDHEARFEALTDLTRPVRIPDSDRSYEHVVEALAPFGACAWPGCGRPSAEFVIYAVSGRTDPLEVRCFVGCEHHSTSAHFVANESSGRDPSVPVTTWRLPRSP